MKLKLNFKQKNELKIRFHYELNNLPFLRYEIW